MNVTLQNFKKMTIVFKDGETLEVSRSERKYVAHSNGIDYIVYDMDITLIGDDTIVTLEMRTVPKDINATFFNIKEGGPIQSITIV